MHPSWLAPFQERTFRFQWPAALITVWALEMETLILGWYVLVQTGSVVQLTIFASFLYFGTLCAPLLGVVADRIGHGNTLALMRSWYMVLAATLLTFTVSGLLSPSVVLVIAFLNGLVRPSDLAIRSAFMAGSLPREFLSGAMALERMTIDTARITGALVGAGLFATIGIAPTYMLIITLYALGVTLTLAAKRGAPVAEASIEASPVLLKPRHAFWHELKEGLAYVWERPVLRAIMWLAVLANLTGFPLTNGLLPYAAREVYQADERGLAFLVASFATGALIGSLTFWAASRRMPLARLMLGGAGVWYAMLAIYAFMPTIYGAAALLLLAGIAQSHCMIAMVVLILRAAAPTVVGRVMGVRILAIYGLPMGILGAGWLIERIGFSATIFGYAFVGLAMVLVLTLRFHADLWRVEAPANSG